MNYCQSLSDRALPHETRSQFMNAALYFTQHTEKSTRKEYRRFVKEEALKLVEVPKMREGILDFLSFCGEGYQRTEKKMTSKRLMKQDERAAKHADEIRGFIVWLQNERDYSPNSLNIYRLSVQSFYQYADEFSQDNVRAFIATIQENGTASPATVALRITALQRFGEYMKKPVKVKRAKLQRKLDTEDVPSEEEYKRLCEYLQTYTSKSKEDYWLLVRLMATTGCRVSELQQFTYEMVQGGEATLKGKGSKYRRFFFNKEMQKYCKEKGKSGVIMTTSTRGLATQLKAFGDRLGIDKAKMHPHAFRHFFAKMYLSKTKDVVELANILGHESVDTTRIYLQKTKEEQQKQFNKTINW